MRAKTLQISLFGCCIVKVSGEDGPEITGSKHRALLVLLATAPMGRRSRAFLQETLWGDACYDGGRQSLRRALSDLRRIMGDSFSEFVETRQADVILDMSKVEFLTAPDDGTFLEGADLTEQGFNEWLREHRLHPELLDVPTKVQQQSFATHLVPVIATIPFNVVEGDVVHAALGDWLAEEINRTLSRSNFLGVISHLSARQLDNRFLNLDDIRSKLDADYGLTGSLRVFGEEVILDVDFLDAVNGQLLWTRQFRGVLSDIKRLNAEMVQDVAAAVGRAVISDAIAGYGPDGPSALDSHKLVIAGVALMHRSTLAAFSRGRQLLEEALERSSKHPELHAWLAKWYILSVINGWTSDAKHDTALAIDLTTKALDLDSSCCLALTMDGFAQNNLNHDFDLAGKRYSEALKVNPNQSLAWLLNGVLASFSGDNKDAVDKVEKAHRLSPLDPFGYFYDGLRASAFLADEQFERALELAERSYNKNNRHSSTVRVRLAALNCLGRGDEARSAAQELLVAEPDFTVTKYLSSHPAATTPGGRIVASAMLDSGIPK